MLRTDDSSVPASGARSIAASAMNALSKLTRHSLARNSLSLYGVQICRKVLPLVTLPFLARVLGAEGWGTVAFVQSLSDIASLFIEFGFNLSATREVSCHRNDRAKCREIMAGVLGAQIVLSLGSLTAMVLALHQLKVTQGVPLLMFAACAYALAQGFSPLWFFQGLEKMVLAASLEVFARLCSLAGLFLWVQALTAGISTLAGIGLAIRVFGIKIPTPGLVLNSLQRGWPMFVFRSAESLYGVGNSFVLGLFASPTVVGYFAIAEKTSKAMFGLLNPVREALYPRLAYLLQSSRREAARLARIGIAVMTLAGLVLTAGILLAAPKLIGLLAGGDFAAAIPVLRVMGLLPLVLSVTYSVGLQWLIPLGRDGVVNRVILTGGLFNLGLAFLLAPHYGAMGMACSVLSAELLVCISLVWYVCRSTDLWADSKLRLRFRRRTSLASSAIDMAGEY
jgi:polysaccharide transporter, PST family